MIDSYSFGRIVVDGKEYTSDVIILPHGVFSNWWRRTGHELSADDLGPVFDAGPEVLVVGTGASGMMKVLPGVREALKENNIELIVERTEEACRVFNRLCRENKAAAALHLTC